MPSTAFALPSEDLDVLEMNEAFEEVDGCFKLMGTLIVYRAGNNLYHAVSKARYSSPSDVRPEHLTDNILIPLSAYSPPFSSRFTRAPEPLPPDSYIKKPRLISYDRTRQGPQPDQLADSFLMEVEVCETLRKHPHPNIAEYLGCQVSQERITGICFAKYHRTLMQAVNPTCYMKRKSRDIRRETKDYSHILQGVESGIRHLHSLGLIHNDINPSNIMLDDNGIAIIIDFGSCRREGEGLDDVGRTYEWYDESVEHSIPKNDFDALEEIRIWLGAGSGTFQFGE